MKYAFAFGLMSVALVLVALNNPKLLVLLIWAAISFAWMAAGYSGLGARVIGKKRNGCIPWLTRIVLLPFLCFAWLVWHIYRVVSREDKCNRVDDKLVVGRRLLASEVDQEFDCFIDLTAEFNEPKCIRTRESYFSFPILDASVPSAEDLNAAVELVEDGNLYIHCAQGHGRTGVFALAVLAHRGRISSVEEGLGLLQKVRPALGLNRSQLRFIEGYLSQKCG